jgi:putative transposase
VEDESECVKTVAMYIDLNPVRAGLVEDPAEYRFCGYAEAVVGRRLARSGIAGFHKATQWAKVSVQYRQALLIQSADSNHSDKVALDKATIREGLDRGAELSAGQVLRLRVRYMSDGMVLGSKNYVNEVFAEHRERFWKKRKSGARALRGVGSALGSLMTARDLQVAPIA